MLQHKNAKIIVDQPLPAVVAWMVNQIRLEHRKQLVKIVLLLLLAVVFSNQKIHVQKVGLWIQENVTDVYALYLRKNVCLEWEDYLAMLVQVRQME